MTTRQRLAVLPYSRLAALMVLSTLALAGCGGNGSNENSLTPSAGPVPPPTELPPATSGNAVHGRYVGTVTIEDQDYFGDALLSVDGDLRLYVGGPYSPSGALQMTRPDGSAQFVGKVASGRNQAIGSGIIIGERCASPHSVRFCSETASADISLAADVDNLHGEIRVVTGDGNESWSLDLGAWRNYYVLDAKPEYLAGQYEEAVAEFSLEGDTVMTVNRAGQLFFQSAHSGCTGNGTLATHANGAFNVYDVTLDLENCSPPHVHLNGTFEGFATETPSSYWNYDFLLRIWLSTPDGAPSRAAVTMLGNPVYGAAP